MATYITLNEDLVCANLTVEAGTSFDANGYDVTTGDVTLDTPFDFDLGPGSTWTVSGNWDEINGGATGTWRFVGSMIVFTGVSKTISRFLGNQFFHDVTIAAGAEITDKAGTASIINAYGNLHIYGRYELNYAQLGVYYGGRLMLYSTGYLEFNSTSLSIYDYFGGGGIGYYHPDATLVGSIFTFTFPKKATSVLVPGDYSDVTTFRLTGGSAAEAELAFTTGTYIFNNMEFSSNGVTYDVGLDLSGTTGVNIYVNDLIGGNLFYNKPQYIDNSSSDARWFFGDDVSLESTYDLAWTKGTGMNVLIGSLDQELNFAGADVGWVHSTKTAGGVDFISGTFEISGNFPGNVELSTSAADIDILDGETLNFEGTFTITAGQASLGAGTTLNFYDDVDWSGCTDLTPETSTMVAKADGTWTWKDNSSDCPYNVTVETGVTMTMSVASTAYNYFYGTVNVYGTMVGDSSIQYVSFHTTAELRLHPYSSIPLVSDDELFFNDSASGKGLTLMDETATVTGNRILWYKAHEGSVLAPGTYDIGLYIYGGVSYLELEPTGAYAFRYLSFTGVAGNIVKYTAPRYMTTESYWYMTSSIAIPYIVDMTNNEKTIIGTYISFGNLAQTATYDWTAGNGVIEVQSTINQVFSVPVVIDNDPIDQIIVNHNSVGNTFVLAYADLYVKGLQIVKGTLDCNAWTTNAENDIVFYKDSIVLNHSPMNAKRISFHGESESNRLSIGPGSGAWQLNGSQGCQAHYVDMQYCTAAGVPGVAFGSIDSGNNVNWSFETATNPIVSPANGLNFIMRTLQDVEINSSNYAMGFYGVGGRLGQLATDEWSSNTFLTDIGGTIGEIQCRNVQYASDTTAYVDHVLTPVDLNNIPNYLGTLNIRLLDDEEIFVALAEAKFYDGKDPANPPNGINIKLAELRHPNYRLNYELGRGDNEWRDVGDGSTFNLSQSPGERGVKSNSMGWWAYTQHDWYVAISVSPQTIGDREFGLQVSVEYL
jgi:hypothetical protein